VALLAAEALDLGDGDPGNADLVQRVLHVVELDRLDDRFDFRHAVALMRSPFPLMPNRRHI
jgi:hypothetical protein